MTVNSKAEKDDIKVSVIVPVFNAEKYLGRCLDSILGQTYKNIEVMVVDDGSSDSSKEILERYKKNDSRIIYSSQNHLGPNIARAKAIKKATGDYAIFVDSDDYIVNNAVEVLIEKVKKYHVDAIRYNAKYSANNEIVTPILKPGEPDRILGGDEILSILLTTYKLNSLCMQLYDMKALKSRKTFNHDIAYGEDFLVNLDIRQNTKRMLAINDALYYYYGNPSSTTKSAKREQVIRNIKERVYVSTEAIEVAQKLELGFKNKVVYSQMKMIRDNILNVNKIKDYKKQDFVNDLSEIPLKNLTTRINEEEFCEYIDSLPLLQRIKNRRIIKAIIASDFDYMWKYSNVMKMIARLSK